MLAVVVVLVASIIYGIYSAWARIRKASTQIPVSVNYHFTRQCNYECGFCFHTAKTSYITPIADAKRGLKLLAHAGMKKINFAGGELFLYPAFMAKIFKYCKEDLNLESVSIVTNGSLLKPGFFRDNGKYIDILAVSCDSFDEEVNVKIGRGKGAHIQNLVPLSKICLEEGIKFKLNTVVNKYNFLEDMNDYISRINPFRWKVFQVLVLEGENNSDKTLRNARRFTIADDEFAQFCARHQHHKSFVPESNAVMKSSYLILDEYLCFLNKGVKAPTKSILDIGVEAAMADVYWDENSFGKRGGIYDWTRAFKENSSPKLDW